MTIQPEAEATTDVHVARWLSPVGRLPRRRYWTAYAGPILGVYVVAGLLDGALGYPLVSWSPYSLVSTLAVVGTAWPATCGGAKRLHDHGVSAWWMLTVWLAFFGAQIGAVNIIGQVIRPVSSVFLLAVAYLVGVKVGDGAANRYGPPTR